MLQRKEEAWTREIVDVLRKVVLFQGFSRSVLRELAESVHRRVYRPDEVLYYEHDPGLGLYVVQRGHVRLVVEDEAGAVHELRHAEAGDVFGILSLLGDFRRQETAQAVSETHVFGFFRPDLNMLAKRNPRAGLEVVATFARHLAVQQTELMHLFMQREGKVPAARLLHGAARRAGEQDPEARNPHRAQ